MMIMISLKSRPLYLAGMAGFPGALFAGCFQAPGGQSRRVPSRVPSARVRAVRPSSPGEAVELLLHVELGLPDTVEARHLDLFGSEQLDAASD